MRLFAERGIAAVTVRDIAAAAGVSAALVIHHYKSKEGLRAAVERRATEAVAELVDGLTDPSGPSLETSSMAALLADRMQAYPALLGYLRRMLVDGGEAATTLYRGFYELTLAALSEFQGAGFVRPSTDEATRAAFLLTNDLAVIVLREQITAVLGVDPLSEQGLVRWTEQVMDVYTHGTLNPPGGTR